MFNPTYFKGINTLMCVCCLYRFETNIHMSQQQKRGSDFSCSTYFF